jgi:PKD repeat protein
MLAFGALWGCGTGIIGSAKGASATAATGLVDAGGLDGQVQLTDAASKLDAAGVGPDGSVTNPPKNLPVPGFAVAPLTLSFKGTFRGAAPDAQTLTMSATGTAPLSVSVVTRDAWLHAASPAVKIMPGDSADLAVSVTTDGLGAGTYKGSLDLTVNKKPFSIPVTLKVAAPSDPALTLEVAATRLQGVAPLSVFFDTEGTVVTGSTQPFHDALFLWNFGDDAAGTWATNGRPKNLASGPLAQHVFEQPGLYTVTTTVVDPNGKSTSKTLKITVDDPDQIFIGTKTQCLSTSGTFDGCPAGAAHITTTSSFNDVSSHLLSATRVLLRRDEQWTVSGGGSIPVSAVQGILGAYGTGAAPVINGGVMVDNFMLNVRGDDWRVMDLDFVGGAAKQRAVVNGPGRDTLLLRLTFTGMYVGLTPDPSSGFGFAAVDLHVKPLVGGAGGYGAYMQTEQFAMQGCRFDDASQVEHVFRAPHLNKAIISNNDLGPAAPTKHLLKIHAPGGGTVYSQQILISDNILHGGPGNAWLVSIAPQNSSVDERIRDVIIERNYLVIGQVDSGMQALDISATHVTVRNNIMDMSVASGSYCISVGQRGIEPAPQNIAIYNNTCFTNHAQTLIAAFLGTGVSDVIALNNLAVSAVTKDLQAIGNFGATNVTDTANVATIEHVFLTDAPTTAADFQLRAGASVIDQGTTAPGLGDDFVSGPRPQDGNGDTTANFDVGAFEYVAP